MSVGIASSLQVLLLRVLIISNTSFSVIGANLASCGTGLHCSLYGGIPLNCSLIFKILSSKNWANLFARDSLFLVREVINKLEYFLVIIVAVCNLTFKCLFFVVVEDRIVGVPDCFKCIPTRV